MKEDWPQKEGWLRQDNLIYVGLIGIGVVIMQPFIAAAWLDLPSLICVLAFSLAIPLLAGLMMLNWRSLCTNMLPIPGTLSSPGLLGKGVPLLVWPPRSGMSCGWREWWFRSVGSWG